MRDHFGNVIKEIIMIFKGSGVAICTPFTDDAINFDTFGKLIDFQLENGTDALVVCGTTGEPSTMTGDEKCSVIDYAVKKAANRVPVIAGVGGNNTADVVASAKSAQECGADGLLAVTPYYNKCTRKGLMGHFRAVADAVDIPLILYNVPSRTGVNMNASTFCELASHKNIAAVKEASSNISQIGEYARVSKGKADIYCGNDDHIVPVLSLGGIGVISVAANIIPKYIHDMVHKFLEGDIEEARDMQLDLMPLADALFCEVNPIPVKTALRLIGFEMGPLRLPLCEMESDTLERLIVELKKFELID